MGGERGCAVGQKRDEGALTGVEAEGQGWWIHSGPSWMIEEGVSQVSQDLALMLPLMLITWKPFDLHCSIPQPHIAI